QGLPPPSRARRRCVCFHRQSCRCHSRSFTAQCLSKCHVRRHMVSQLSANNGGSASMLRVAALCALSGAILVLTGCASDLPSTPAPKGAGRVSQGASTVIIKIKTCETTYVQDNACAVPKTCPKIATCAETDYLLKVCGHPLDKNKNNVPCEVTG